MNDSEYVADFQAERCQEYGCPRLVLICHKGGTIWIPKHSCGATNMIERLALMKPDTVAQKDLAEDVKKLISFLAENGPNLQRDAALNFLLGEKPVIFSASFLVIE
ncbi:MAG: hypothetical protein WC397_04655 [Candidatus Paceibacterota bacterium]|jgi:hypothetical protein